MFARTHDSSLKCCMDGWMHPRVDVWPFDDGHPPRRIADGMYIVLLIASKHCGTNTMPM